MAHVINKSQTVTAGEDVEKRELSCTVGGNINWYSHYWIQYVKMKVAQSCLTLCDPMDCRVHGILQARILEWVAFPFSRESSQLRDQTQVLPYYPAIPLLGIYHEKTKIEKDTCTPMFTATLSIIARTWK